jgi:hypothetical protein
LTVALSQLLETMMSPRMERIPFGTGIFMMRYSHEFGEHRSSEDVVV